MFVGKKKEEKRGKITITSTEVDGGLELSVQGFGNDLMYYKTIRALIKGLSEKSGIHQLEIVSDLTKDIITEC